MKINFVTKTIEVSKTFATKASHFGTEEYRELRTAMNDLSGFCVEIKAAASPCRTYMRGLTYDHMESYISMVDEDGSLVDEFQQLRHECNYATVKKWFMTVLPESQNFAA